MKTVIEPFRTKVVEPINFNTQIEREQILKLAGFNLFGIKAKDVIIDFLTDSGTSAMSSIQWAELMRGDESYAGCSSFYKFHDAVSKIFGFDNVIPVHQGRAAERILFNALIKSGDHIPNNTHFDTTRANIENTGATALDFPDFSDNQFRGNIDVKAVDDLIAKVGKESIPLAMITLTNNSGGGQPASLENIRSYKELLKRYNIPLYIDAARYAENAWLIKRRSNLKDSIESIVNETFAGAEGCLMSAKKDGLSNMGGFIATHNKKLVSNLEQDLILTEGFLTYGGLTGRDLECIAQGLYEALDESYLLYREKSSTYLADGLLEHGVPIIQPPGLNAIYLDARKFLPHIEPKYLPGQALACELYIEAGLRSCEIGTLMFGVTDKASGEEIPHHSDLVRLALPRRVYSQSHYDYVIEAVANVFNRADKISGFNIAWQPKRLRHFTARFEKRTQSTSDFATERKAVSK